MFSEWCDHLENKYLTLENQFVYKCLFVSICMCELCCHGTLSFFAFLWEKLSLCPQERVHAQIQDTDTLSTFEIRVQTFLSDKAYSQNWIR